MSAVMLGTSALKGQDKTDSTVIQKDFQFTFITPLGTNGTNAPKCVNKLSLNLLAGIGYGVDGLELGGFMNVVRKDVRGIQLAGFANSVFANVKGIQGAGYFNYAGGNLLGVQASGFTNVNLGKTTGGQFAGFVNYNGDSLYGAQLSGFANCNVGDLKGAQLAGFANYNHRSFYGLQGSGFVNVNRGNMKGAQLAGFGNLCFGDMEGMQVSGFVNVAKKVKGAQIGVLNVADSVDGVSVGLLTIVKKGLHQLEVSADELFYTSLSLRTGTHKFYNVFTAGASSRAGSFVWNMGYGIGTSFKIRENLRSDMSLTAQHVSKGLLFFGTSELYKFYWGLEYKLANKCYIAMGPTFNLYVGDTLLPAYKTGYNGLAPYSLLNETSASGFNYKAWFGAKVALRFL